MLFMMYDLGAILISLLLILIYYTFLNNRTRRNPNSSVHAVNAKIRERWVEMVISKDNMEILAVQTLRNSVMASSFMASTAVLLIIGSLNLTEKIGQWSLHWDPLGLDLKHSSSLWQAKLGLLVLDFALAFFCFSMAIRFFNHVGYLINLPRNTSSDASLNKQTCLYLNRAGNYYTLGNRSFFFSLPIIMWFFGPYFLLLGSLGLIFGLAQLDKAQK